MHRNRTKSRRRRMKAVWLLPLLCAWSFAGESGLPHRDKTGADGQESANLRMLRQWGGEIPEPDAAVFEAAYAALAKDGAASFAQLAANADFQKICREQRRDLLGGPMLGDVRPGGVSIWCRTVRPATLQVRVTAGDEERTYGPVASTAATDLTAVVPVTGLTPGARYPYRVLVDGATVPGDRSFSTAPAQAETGIVRMVFGTCYHRTGLGNAKLAAAMLAREPTAFLAYGDIAVEDRSAHCGLVRADYLARDFFPAWRKFASAVPVFAVWDDHDYYNNDSGGFVAMGKKGKEDARPQIREVFRHAWCNPAYGFGADGGRGIFFRTRIGPCDVIMLDTRYFRYGPGERNVILGDAQMAWLETQLQDCKGPFIVLSSGTMWSDYISDGKDSWGKHDREGRERIFDLIEQNRVPGVLLISGDRHGARGFRIPRRSGFAFYEFEVASLGGKRVSSTPVLRSKARIRSPNCSVSEAPAPSGSSP